MQIVMPKLGLTMTEGTVTEWLKAAGDAVRASEILFVFESEKVTLEYEAPADGRLAEILVAAGTTVPCGTPLCLLETAKDTGAGPARPASTPGRLPVVAAQEPAGEARASTPAHRMLATPKARALASRTGVDLQQLQGRGPQGRIHAADVTASQVSLLSPLPAGEGRGGQGVRGGVKATPLAHRIAAAEGLDLAAIPGTGPGRRVTREDLEAAQGRAEAVIPLSGIRQVIAQRMSESAFTAPHVTLMTEAEATNLVSARAQLNGELPEDERISYNALLAALAAKALREHRGINARLAADGIHLLPEISIALAIETERGLMTPVLKGADKLSIPEIQRGYDALFQRALAGRSLPDDFTGGTFTITNLGALDVDGFTPIINPPQAAILGVGRIVEKPVAREGAVVIRPMVVLSLSFDHRIVDGAPAARFLQRIKQLVERPMALLIG